MKIKLGNDLYGICSDLKSKELLIKDNKGFNIINLSDSVKEKVKNTVDNLNKKNVDYVLNLLEEDMEKNPNNSEYLKLEEDKAIKQFSRTYLSNLWATDVFYKGIMFPSTEHGYMYHKFNFKNIKKYFNENPDNFEKIKDSLNKKYFLSELSEDTGLKDFMTIDNIEKVYFDKRGRGGFIKKLSIEFEELGLRNDNWNDIKLETMVGLLIEKFSSGELKQKLLETGDKKLIEGNHWGDVFWGIDNNTLEGKNILGRALAILRDEINK